MRRLWKRFKKWVSNKRSARHAAVETGDYTTAPLPPFGSRLTVDHMMYAFSHASQTTVQELLPIYNNMFTYFGITSREGKAHLLAQVGKESSDWRYSKELGSKWYFKRYIGRLGNSNSPFSNDYWKYCGQGDIQLTGRNHYVNFTNWINSQLKFESFRAWLGVTTEHIDFVSHPELVRSAPWRVLVVFYYWTVSRKLNDIAISGVPMACDGNDICTPTCNMRKHCNHALITKGVNGGYNGLADRQERLIRLLEVIK